MYALGVRQGLKNYLPHVYTDVYNGKWVTDCPECRDMTLDERVAVYDKLYIELLNYISKVGANVRPNKTERIKLDEKPVVFAIWLQGYDNAPKLVQKCIDSIKRHANGHKVMVLSHDDIITMVKPDDKITSLWKNGKLSHAHYCDYLRVCLLEKYDAIYLDATILLTKDIDERLFNASDLVLLYHDYFCTQNHRIYLSRYKFAPIIYVLGGNSNYYFSYIKALYEEYFKNHEYIITYHFLTLLTEYAVISLNADGFTQLDYPQIEALNAYKAGSLSEKTVSKYLNYEQGMYKLTYKGVDFDTAAVRNIIEGALK